MSELDLELRPPPDVDSKKRKSPAVDDENAAKKQKTLIPDRSHTGSVAAEAANLADQKLAVEEESMGNAAKYPRERKNSDHENTSHGGTSETSPEESLTVTRKDFDLLKAEAREQRYKRDDRISALEVKVKDLKAKLSESDETFEERLSTMAAERDDWQQLVLDAQSENAGLVKNQEEYKAAFWEEVQGWKRKEIKRQTEAVKEAYAHKYEKSERAWKKKFETQDRRHTKEKSVINDRLGNMRAELRQNKETLKLETKRMKEEQRAFMQEHKPENTAKVKELEKVASENGKTIKALRDSLDSAKGEVEDLTEENKRLRNEGHALSKTSQQKVAIAAKYQADAAAFEGRFNGQLLKIESMKRDHEAELKKQVEKWQIQRNNSDQNAQRAASNQRATQMLSYTNLKLIAEKQDLADRLAEAESEARRLRAANTVDAFPPRHNAEETGHAIQ